MVQNTSDAKYLIDNFILVDSEITSDFLYIWDLLFIFANVGGYWDTELGVKKYKNEN